MDGEMDPTLVSRKEAHREHQDQQTVRTQQVTPYVLLIHTEKE